MNRTPIVSFQNVSKTYHSDGLEVTALADLNLTIDSGEFLTVAGPSGSGKSTLLHLIGALDQPTEGVVSVQGRDLRSLPDDELSLFRLRTIGFVFQAYNLIPVLNAQENVEYPLLLQKVDRAERERRSVELLERVGLSDQRRKRPGEMSGGQQQRVAVARALVTRPQIVLADEPTANLDSHTGAGLIDLFRELNNQFKVTFLFASHDPMVIERAQRVIRLHDGRIVP